MKNNIFNIVIISLLAFLAVSNYFKKEEYPSAPIVVRPKIIGNNILNKEREIQRETVIVDRGKQVIIGLNGRLEYLTAELAKFKSEKDTFNIVPTQDTMIRVLYFQGQVKDTVINSLERTVSKQRYIITAKDTLLTDKDMTIKKVKRQRNISLLLNGVLTTFLILK